MEWLLIITSWVFAAMGGWCVMDEDKEQQKIGCLFIFISCVLGFYRVFHDY